MPSIYIILPISYSSLPCCMDLAWFDTEAVCSLQDAVDATQVQRLSSRQDSEAKASRDQLGRVCRFPRRSEPGKQIISTEI